MKSQRIDVAAIRREQIVKAAVEIIAAKGLPELSLSRIEKKARMSRGQLTYYFRTKEEILLAVFDRLVQLMHERVCQEDDGPSPAACHGDVPDFLERLLRHVLRAPASHPEFHALQYTFLGQIGHRADFRKRLARLYEEWRSGVANYLASQLKAHPRLQHVSPRTLASVIQAMLHGIAVQLVADPKAFAPEEMLALCLEVLAPYLNGKSSTNGKTTVASNGVNGTNGKRLGRTKRTKGISKVVIS